jgi:hypothetical protein
MTGFNLPPGVNVSDLPGNRPEDEEHERSLDWLSDQIEGFSTEEVQAIWVAGIVAQKIQDAFAGLDFS